MWKISAPVRSASVKLPAPAGTTMNSWMSRPLSACAPPLRTFMNGTGSTRAPGPPRYWYSGRPESSAAARATASETPRIALAPSEDLFGVPSSSSSAWSTAACSAASIPSISGAMVSITFCTARRTPLPR